MRYNKIIFDGVRRTVKIGIFYLRVTTEPRHVRLYNPNHSAQ